MTHFSDVNKLSQYAPDFQQWLSERKPQKDAFKIGDRVFSARYLEGGIGIVSKIDVFFATIKFANTTSDIPLEDLELEDVGLAGTCSEDLK